MGDSENLQSAALDLEAADALVQQVEDNLFNKAEEEAAADAAAEAPDLLDGEQQVSAADEQVFAVSDAQEAELAQSNEEMTEEELAEATIARMIAEQESLLKKAGDERGDSPAGKASKPAEAPAKAASQPERNASSAATLNEEQLPSAEDIAPQANSVFGNDTSTDTPSTANETVDEDELAAAMEEEMMAQLEDEQAQLLTEQTESNDENASKTLSDLASKFE